MKIKLLLLSLLALSPLSQAAFVVTSATFGLNGSVVGTSNNVGFTHTGLITSLSQITGYNGFTGSNFSSPLPNTSMIHIGGPSTFTFDRNIQSALVYLSENAVPSAIHNFGVEVERISGDVEILAGNGFRVTSTTGGIVRLNNLSTNVLNLTSAVFDGVDFAILVTPAKVLPEPSSVMLSGLGALGLLARRRRNG